jgi:hypothetical protein
MKQILIFLIAIVLPPAALRPQTSPAAPAPQPQALPDAPSPAPLSDPAWDRLKNLTNGEPIVVRNDNGPPVHCLFAGATDANLFCNPPGNPLGVGFRFDRASVISVDFDLPARNVARFDRPLPNHHPAYLASIIAGGLIVGIVATQTADSATAADEGLIGALVVAAIGAPLAFLPHPFDAGFAYQPRGFGRMHSSLAGFHPRPFPRVFHAR